jgi:hypothetical protein
MFREQNSVEEPIPPAPFPGGEGGEGKVYWLNQTLSHGLIWSKTA